MRISASRILLILLGLAVLGILIYFGRNLIAYVVVAALLSLIGRPVFRLIKRIKIKNWQIPDVAAAIVSLLALFLAFMLLFLTFVPLVISQTENIANLDRAELLQNLEEPISLAEDFLHSYNLAPESESIRDFVQRHLQSLATRLQPSELLNNVLGITGNFFIAIFSIIFIAFFFLKEPNLLPDIFYGLIPDQFDDRVAHAMKSAQKLLSRYFIGVLLEVLLVGGLVSIGLSILGIQNAVAIGFFAGLFNVIPYLGPVIGAGLGLILSLLGSLQLDFYAETIPLLLKVIVVFVVVQMIDNFILQPFIYSSSVKAHPLEIFLVILLAGNIFGVVGMILAIPTYTVLRVLAKEFFNKFEIVQQMTRDI